MNASTVLLKCAPFPATVFDTPLLTWRWRTYIQNVKMGQKFLISGAKVTNNLFTKYRTYKKVSGSLYCANSHDESSATSKKLIQVRRLFRLIFSLYKWCQHLQENPPTSKCQLLCIKGQHRALSILQMAPWLKLDLVPGHRELKRGLTQWSVNLCICVSIANQLPFSPSSHSRVHSPRVTCHRSKQLEVIGDHKN
jgi:hypothetical protein